MRFFTTTLLAVIVACMSHIATAQYSVYDLSGDVKVQRSGSTVAAEKNMSLKAPDYVIIPEGAWIQIHSKLGSKLYKSTESGTFKVTDIIFNSEHAAKDNERNIRTGIALSGSRDKNNSVYVDRGVVTRSLAQFDPDADNRTVDTDIMARVLCSTIISGKGRALPVDFAGHANAEDFSLTLNNIMQSPVYFNVVKYDDKTRLASVSELGIPVGNYVLPAGNTLTRMAPAVAEHVEGVHLVILTYYTYDIDEVLNKVNELLATEGAPDLKYPDDAPVYTARL